MDSRAAEHGRDRVFLQFSRRISTPFQISLGPRKPTAQAVLAKRLIQMLFPRELGHRKNCTYETVQDMRRVTKIL